VTESTIRRGYDTFVNESFPSTEHSDDRYLKIDATTSARKRAYVYFPLPSLAGRTVLSATLSMVVRNTGSAQTISAQAVASHVPMSTMNWSNQPGVTGSVFSTTTGALVNGSVVAVDVGAALQAVANGAKWFGFRVTTGASAELQLWSFESGQDTWTLTYELSDAPEQPTLLSPDGGVVSKTKPVVSWDFTDFGGSTEQAALQVQVDTAANAGVNLLTSPTWAAAGTPVPTVTPNSSVRAFEGTVSDALITWAGSGGFPQAQATVSGLTIGNAYTFVVYCYSVGSLVGVIPIFGTAVGSTFTVKNAWTQASVSFTATATSHTVAVRGNTPVNGDTTWIDKATVIAGSTVHPGFDSGQIAGIDPELDLNTVVPPFAGFSVDGGTDQWRVRVKDGAGLWSDWSDWSMWTYKAKPTLVMDSPSGTLLSDPSPTILAHISSGTLTAFRIRVAAGSDKTRLRYDSGKRSASGTSLAHTIPFKNTDEVKIFKDDASYWLNVRVWDTYDREGTPGDPPYMETWVLVTFNDDGAVSAPTLSSVTQPGILPKVQLVWTRGSAPDNWVVLKDGEKHARLDPADVSSGGGTYTWQNPEYTEAYESHTWKVKAMVAGVQGPPSNSIAFKPTLSGVWLVDPDTDLGVMIRETGVSDWRRLDRFVKYKPVNRNNSVNIYDAQEGLSGSMEGVIDDGEPYAITTARGRLRAFKDAPTKAVWLLAMDVAVKVRLENLSWSPSPEAHETLLRDQVSFSFEQAWGIPYGIGS